MSKCNATYSTYYIYENFMLYMFSWFHLLMILGGLFGSTLCFIVILRYRVFTHSTRYWFLALTLSDVLTIVLCATDLYAYTLWNEKFIYFLDMLGVVGCEIRVSIIVALSWASNLLQAGLSIERMISILSPLKARIFFNVRRTRICLGIIVGVCVVGATAINFLTFHFNSETNTCEFRKVNLTFNPSEAFYTLDLFVFRVIPYIIMFLSSLLITVFMRHSRATRKQMTQQSNSHCVAQTQGEAKAASSNNRELRMSVLLLAMNFTTLLTNPAFIIFELIDGKGTENQPYGKLTGSHCLSDAISKFFNSILYFNNATNWCFYVAVGSRFRSRFLDLLKQCLCIQSHGSRCQTCCIGGSNRRDGNIEGTSMDDTVTLDKNRSNYTMVKTSPGRLSSTSCNKTLLNKSLTMNKNNNI